MSIRITRYVDITSGVGGANPVPRRDLVLREVTQSALVPAGAVAVFGSADDVGKFFGTAADEFKVAEKYFGFVSKQIVSPDKMSFIRWNVDSVAPAVYGSPLAVGLTSLKAITTGTLMGKVGAVPFSVVGIDLSAATSMADVATALQVKLRTSPAAQLVTCTVVYETNRGAFILSGAVKGASEDLIVFGTGGLGDMSVVLGWATGLQVNAAGYAAQTAAEAISSSASEDDNFGSFGYCGAVLPTATEYESVAAWNHGQNNKFFFCLPTSGAGAAAFFAAMKGYSGTAMTLVPGAIAPADHAETCPAEILASTNYLRPAASQNYMFYQFGNRVATVKDDTAADVFEAVRCNYIGQTQSAGQKLSFYQPGFLMGDASAAVDMTVYAGEIWLKDSLVSTIMGGFLALPTMPANEGGRITLLSLMQETFNQALDNGVFSVGKTLTAIQKAYIGQVTGNTEAWRQVQEKGYWVNAQITSKVVLGVTRYTAEYVLLYGKNDQIRKVTGSDILI